MVLGVMETFISLVTAPGPKTTVALLSALVTTPPLVGETTPGGDGPLPGTAAGSGGGTETPLRSGSSTAADWVGVVPPDAVEDGPVVPAPALGALVPSAGGCEEGAPVAGFAATTTGGVAPAPASAGTVGATEVDAGVPLFPVAGVVLVVPPITGVEGVTTDASVAVTGGVDPVAEPAPVALTPVCAGCDTVLGTAVD
jgi:hypothetical protein